MALTAEQRELLDALEEAVNIYADKETLRLRKRAALLRRLNTKVDDFVSAVVSTQAQMVITDIDSMLEG